jgi:HAD superfamily hydrolase (TIGR01509 family)
MKKIAVGFDFDHTLGMDNHLERRAFEILAAQFDSPLDVEQKATHEAIEDLLAPFRAAEESMTTMMERFAAKFLTNGAPSNPNGEELAGRYRQICYDLVTEMVEAVPGAIECIRALVAAEIPVAILTNGWSELQERKIEHALGEFPGPVLVSDLVGAYKPSAAAFRQLEEALGVTPAELWYVGDNPVADIDGARAYGLRAVWLNRGGDAYPAQLAEPTAQIEHLDALAAVVRGT